MPIVLTAPERGKQKFVEEPEHKQHSQEIISTAFFSFKRS